jgi:hypothetical protein
MEALLDFKAARASANSTAVQLLNHTHLQLINSGFKVREPSSFRKIRVPQK